MRNMVKRNGLLAEIALGAKKAGLDKMTAKEIDAEILSYRRGKKQNKK